MEDRETINSRWESQFGRKTTISERIPSEQVYTSLANSLSELQKLRDNSNMPQVLLDLWESKFNRWLSNLSTTTEEV